jgi:hypothetical protein
VAEFGREGREDLKKLFIDGDGSLCDEQSKADKSIVGGGEKSMEDV